MKFRPELNARLLKIAALERRSKAAVIDGLLERALRLYDQDGLIFPPPEPSVVPRSLPVQRPEQAKKK